MQQSKHRRSSHKNNAQMKERRSPPTKGRSSFPLGLVASIHTPLSSLLQLMLVLSYSLSPLLPHSPPLSSLSPPPLLCSTQGCPGNCRRLIIGSKEYWREKSEERKSGHCVSVASHYNGAAYGWGGGVFIRMCF